MFIFLFLLKIEEKIIIILRQLHHFVFAHFKPPKISKYVFFNSEIVDMLTILQEYSRDFYMNCNL